MIRIFLSVSASDSMHYSASYVKKNIGSSPKSLESTQEARVDSYATVVFAKLPITPYSTLKQEPIVDQ